MQNNIEYTNDEMAYMEQEEEWEREGLLDPAWEKQQKKVGILIFVWRLNAKLKKKNALNFVCLN